MDDDYINKIFSAQDLSKLSEEERREIQVEGLQLAGGRLYMVILPEGPGKVSVRCFDTTSESLNSSAHILLHGLLTVLETSYEDIMKLGHESIVQELMEGLGESEEKKPRYESVDNIIKVNFPEGSKEN